jgi:hypothetical protein
MNFEQGIWLTMVIVVCAAALIMAVNAFRK